MAVKVLSISLSADPCIFILGVRVLINWPLSVFCTTLGKDYYCCSSYNLNCWCSKIALKYTGMEGEIQKYYQQWCSWCQHYSYLIKIMYWKFYLKDQIFPLFGKFRSLFPRISIIWFCSLHLLFWICCVIFWHWSQVVNKPIAIFLFLSFG